MAARQRIDQLLVERDLAPSRQKAQALIRCGQVRVDGVVVDKPGTSVPVEAELAVAEGPRFVSRGGEKLDAAMDAFSVSAEGLICADLGASTGGFTDCLLQRGAARVYAVDVGYGQLDWRLRQDDRVVVMERTNARHLESLPEAVALVVGDLSFISLDRILPAALRIAAPGAQAVVLVKPQFEVGRGKVGKGGVVRDPVARQQAVDRVAEVARDLGCTVRGSMESPIRGARKGNVEYLLHLQLPGADA